MSWVSLADTATMSADQQVRVHFAQTCSVPGFQNTHDELSQAIAAAGSGSGGGSVASVADVSGDTLAGVLNIGHINTDFYVALINPVDGASVGQLRADVTNALVALQATKVVPCNNFSVGTIESDDGSGLLGGLKLPSSTGIPLSLLALAAIALVVLIFVKVR